MKEIDELAAGLALGTLDPGERAAARELEAHDPAFRRQVEAIERRLAPLAAGLPAEAPPAGLLAAIEARIDEAKAALPGTITLRAGEYDWQPLGEGIDAALLWRNEKASRQSLLIRMQPGARYESHAHEDDEECLVIEGDLVFGELTLKTGDFHFAPKGRTHPSAFSPSGCLLYVTSGC
jgi:quercetin dioxygenase-like cupin family protein